MEAQQTVHAAAAQPAEPQIANVRVSRSGNAGRITLDRPAKLNALTPAMVDGIHALLAQWASDSSLRTIVLDGAGPRGFCAGGDLRIVTGAPDIALQFWGDEYRLNAYIAEYAKPIVAFMSGIVMGGGVGISAHTRHRIVTGSTQIAMPEAGIGLIPDVGSNWIVSRAPGKVGTFFALTGTPVGAADALLLGLADAFVAEENLAALRGALLSEAPADNAAVRAVVARFAASAGPAPLAQRQSEIDRWFGADSMEEIVAALERDGSPFARETALTLARRSPTSLKLTLRALREARAAAHLNECLALEYRIMVRRIDAADFHEGVRAQIVDKDRRPVWRPAALQDVTPADLDAQFASLGAAEWQP